MKTFYSKMVLTLCLLLGISVNVMADDGFAVQNFSLEPGESKEVSVEMNNANPVWTIGCEIYLSEGLSFETPYYDENNDEYRYTSLVAARKGAGASISEGYNGTRLKVGITTTNSNVEKRNFKGNSGAIFTFTVKAPDNAAGTYSITVKNIELTYQDNSKFDAAEVKAKATIIKDCAITIGVNNADFGSATLDPNPSTGIVKSGTEFTATATPKTGYKFVKWSDGSTENPYTFTLNDDLDLKAVFEALKFNIIFYQEDGTTKIEEKTYDYNAAITAPNAPKKEGWTFKAWDPSVPTNALANGEYKATYTINKYKVKFLKKDGKTVIQEEELPFESAITAPEVPTEDGYTFKAWDPSVDATVPAKDVTYQATYTINQYTVKFINPKDGSTIKEEKLDYGAKITAPDAPDWDGHTFLGWKPAVDATVPAKDVTYTADYDAKSYNVIYMVNEKEWKKESVKFEFTLPEDPTPEVEGYTFKGWTWSTGDKPATMPANDVTATAVLEIKTNTVKFFEENGTTQIGADFTGVYNSDITAPTAPTKTGYTFDGWTIIGGDDTVLASVTKIPGNNTSYKAHYTVNKHNIIYKVDGEVYQEVKDVAYGTELTPIEKPTKEGYTFDEAWTGLPDLMPDEDVIVTGEFHINQYTIAFVTLNEDGSVKETIQSTTQNYATDIVAPNAEDAAIFAKLNREEEGWIWKGWALQEAPETQVEVAEKVPAKNLTYVAYYVPNIVYVFYIVDGDTVYTETVDYKAAIPAYKDPAKEGHTFSGWTWRNEDGSKIYETKPAKMPAENVVAEGTLNVNKYLVTFISEGETIYSEMLDYGTPIEAPKPAGDRGYELVGWDPVLLATVPANDVTFTAQFKLMSYTITYILDGEEYQRVETPYGTEITPLVVDKEGYTFSGWLDLPEYMPARDIKAFGSCYINQYRVTFVGGGVIAKEEMLDYGTPIEVPEAPAFDGMRFVEWADLLETVPAYDVVFTAVYVEAETIEPVEEETKVEFSEALVNEAGEAVSLSNAVVRNTYYNFDPAKGDGYDTTEKCLVLNTSTSAEQMEEVAEAELGSNNMANKFAGIILSVKGEGSFEIDCQTLGEKELMVKIGDEEPKAFKMTERGLAELNYNTAEDTPIYIYAAETGSGTADDALKIWSVNIVPTTPVAIKTIREAIEKGSAYTIDGRKLNTVPTKKGFYIINGKKMFIK